MENNFKTLHYDGTISLHGTLVQAIDEAKRRLEPWRDAEDFIARRIVDKGSHIERVLVLTSRSEPTDAESHISPCGDWIDARQCLPKVSQQVVACWLEERADQIIVETTISDTDFMKWALRHASNPTRAWWRPLPALPVECEEASEC